MKPTIRITGTKDISRRLDAMGKALRKQTLMPLVKEGLEPMADEMRARAARGSGQMTNSVTVSEHLSPAQSAQNVPIAEVEAYAGPGPNPQAIQEEFGNFRQSPRPFIRPAFDVHVDRALKHVARGGIDLVLKAAKKG